MDDSSSYPVINRTGMVNKSGDFRNNRILKNGGTYMAEQQTGLSVSMQIKSMINDERVKKKFNDVLGNKAPQFLASITNVVSGSTQLQKCDSNSIMAAAFVAATYDLPIDSNFRVQCDCSLQ